MNKANNTQVQPFIINNSASSAAASASSGRAYRHYSGFWNFILILFTGGLWIFWMIFRPKYY